MEFFKIFLLSLDLVTATVFTSPAPVTEPAEFEAVNVVIKGWWHSPHLTYFFPVLTDLFLQGEHLNQTDP